MPNTYARYCPNVFVAKCEEQHEKGDTITMQTRHGKEHDAIVFNLVAQSSGFFYYSVVRADGFNVQEFAKRRAERLNGAANNAQKKSGKYWEAANEGRDFLVLGEPIKIGHHSEKKHRALIERNHARIGNAIKQSEVAETYAQRAEYWEGRKELINLSMPESLEYFEHLLEGAKDRHQDLKDNPEKRTHSFSLTYAKKEVNEIENKIKIARKLWA